MPRCIRQNVRTRGAPEDWPETHFAHKLSGMTEEPDRTVLIKDTLHYVGFTPADLRALVEVFPYVKESLPEMSEEFYRALQGHANAMRVFAGPEQMERLKRTLQIWGGEVFTVKRDAAYFSKRLRIGEVHVAIGVSNTFILGAMGRVRRFLSLMIREKAPKEMHRRALAALERALDLDLILMTESYQNTVHFQDLEESMAHTRRILFQAPLAIFSFDRAGRIREWNSAASHLFGYGGEEVIGKTVHDVIGMVEERELMDKLSGRIFDGEHVPALDRAYRRSDGVILNTIVTYAPLRGPNGIEEAVAFTLDVTQMAEMREKFIEQEKVAALGTLAAGLAHEVGNPLSSISAICQLIEKKGDDGRLKERMKTVGDALARIDSIVRRVLDFARRGDDSDTVDLGVETRKVVDLIRLDRRLRKIEIHVEISEQVPTVKVSRTGLSQILVNLLLNAGEAIWERGEPGTISLKADVSGRGVRIAVEDNGPGFSADSMRRAIEPFYSTKSSGTGLGLAVSYGIVERSGGKLSFANRPEGGAVVTMWLPSS